MAEDTPRQRLRIGLPPDWITPRGDEIPPKVETYNPDYKPGGGDKKIFHEKVTVQANSKVNSLENQTYQPAGGDKPIFNERLEFEREARAKIGSLDNADYKPGGGDKQFVYSERLQWTNQPVLNTRENLAYQTRPSDVRVFNDQLDFAERAEPKVGSLDNKDYEPKQSGIRVYNERLPWLAHESNRPRLRRSSGDETGDGTGGYGARREYSRQVEGTAQHQQQHQQQPQRQQQRPRRAASEEGAAAERAALRERQREFAQRTKAEAAAKPAATRPRQLPNERDPKPANAAAEAAAAERRRLREQLREEQQQKEQQRLREQQRQKEQQRKEQQRQQDEKQRKEQQQKEQLQKQQQQKEQQQKKQQQQQKQQQKQQPGNNSRAEQKPSGQQQGGVKRETQQAMGKSGSGGAMMAQQKQPKQPKTGQAEPRKKKAAGAKQKTQQQPQQPQQPQREPDEWEYARHEYERPKQQPAAKEEKPKKGKSAAAEEAEDEEEAASVPPLELSSEGQQAGTGVGSRGVKDLYKTEGYAKRFELAPASVTNRSLMLQPLENYRHDWHEDADVKIRLDPDGRLVLKSNRKVPTRLPRVAADSTEPPARATYVSSISKKERPLYDPKPKRVTGEDLGHLLPRLENLLEAPQAPKKHYSQYSVDRKPAAKDAGYGETMKRQRGRQGHAGNPDGERVVLMSSDDYNNQFYSEVRVRDAEMRPRAEGQYGKKFEDLQRAAEAAAAEEPQADELSDRLMLQPSDQLPHYRPDSDDGAAESQPPSVDYANSESLHLQQQQQQQQQQRKQKRFVNWKPGQVLYATGERAAGGGGGAAYSDRLQRQRQRQRGEGGGPGFTGLHEQRKNWYQDYNQRMLAREGNVERVNQRDLLLTTYELY